MSRVILVVLLALLGAACSSTGPLADADQGLQVEQASSVAAPGQPGEPKQEQPRQREPHTEQTSGVEPEEALAPQRAEAPIPAQSLYPLLLAEFALRRDDFELALETYMEQAKQLEDAGVRAHTTHIAQHLRNKEAIFEAAQLWAEIEPDNLEVNNILAGLFAAKGQPSRALEHLAVLARAGEEPKYPALLGAYRTLSKQERSALETGINELHKEFPENPQLLLTQALIQAESGQHDKAMEFLHQLFQIEPHQYQAVVLEAKILLDQKADKPFTRMEQTLEVQPEKDELRLQYARLLTRTDLAAARLQFERLSKASPRNGDLLFSLGLIDRELGDLQSAKVQLSQMLSLGQRIDDGHFYLGRIAEQEDDAEAAITHYEKVENGNDFFSANNRIGHLYLEHDQQAQMQEYFSELRQKKPQQRAQLYALEIDLLKKAGDRDAAMNLLNDALIEFPDSTALRYTRSMLGEEQNNLALMESDLRAIIDREPNNATALNALGYSLANRTERFEEAQALIAKALELSPNEPAILDSMGWVLYRQGSYNEAVEFLTRAYSEYPDPEVAAHLGEVLWVTGKTDAAKDVWRGALLKEPEHKILASTLKRLGITDLEVDR